MESQLPCCFLWAYRAIVMTANASETMIKYGMQNEKENDIHSKM